MPSSADLASAPERARAIADDVLFPAAEATDRADRVPAGNLAALRDAGLNGLQGPSEVPGGAGADHVSARPVFEAIAGGCGATAFVWAQHHGAVRRCAGGDGPARAVWLPRLCDGSVTAGIGFAYLRRPGPAAVRARPIPGGWRLDGEAPWITAWGLADVFVIMARADDGGVISVLLDRPYDRPEVVPSPPQRLAVMGSTGTVSLMIDGLVLDASSVIGVQTDAVWAHRDRMGSALPPAAPLGTTARAISLLQTRGTAPGIAEATAALTEALRERRRAADEVAGQMPSGPPDDGREARAWVEAGARERDLGLGLARRATDALVAASGGGAMSLAHPAQRLSREATFYLIQAQTGALRAATLARLARTLPGPIPR